MTTKGQTVKTTLTTTQRIVLGCALVPMIAVGIGGGIGSYSNISGAYGSGTALGALSAGEGATAVLALILLGLTLLGQSSPLPIRIGLWMLPGAAAAMGATAATGTGETIVYALTPMAITASAEGLAFLVRRIVVHQEGRDAEAEARGARVVRDLAYQRARAASHPTRIVRYWSVRRSWRLGRRVGAADVALGVRLLEIQRDRLTAGADAALAEMFGLTTTHSDAVLPHTAVPALPAAADNAPASDVTTPRHHDATTHSDADVRPDTADVRHYSAEQQVTPAAAAVIVRPDTADVRPASVAAAVRDLLSEGVTDPDTIAAVVPARMGKGVAPTTVKREVRRQRVAVAAADNAAHTGQYL